MKKNSAYILILLLLMTAVLFLFDLIWGNMKIPFREIIAVISNGEKDSIYREIIINFRLPKAIAAVLAGSALAVSGLMMQTLFRNPLADPYVLGVSSGASMGVALVMLSTGIFVGISGWITILAAVIGAAVVMLLVVGVSFRVRNAVSLLIVGIMLGTIVSSLVGVLQYYSNPDAIKLFVLWNLGSLSSVTHEHLRLLTPVIITALLFSYLLSNRLDSFLLGENYARGLGVPITQTRIIIVVLTSLLAGSITAFTGPIGFVGIAIPHIARGVFKTSKHRILIPGSILLGASLLLVCDLVSQIPTYTLPINTISSLFGAPIIIWIILKQKR